MATIRTPAAQMQDRHPFFGGLLRAFVANADRLIFCCGIFLPIASNRVPYDRPLE